MSEHSLQSAISYVAERALSEVSDRILRMEVSKDWPVSKALIDLHKRAPLRVLVRRPFKTSDFKGLKVTENAGVATGWRNNKGRKYAVLLLGTETGNLDAGLKDVRPLPRMQVVEEWRKRVIKRIGGRGDLGKFEVHDLLEALFKGVANGEFPASQLADYIDVLDKKPTVEAVSNNLWRLGLIPDGQALDRSMASARLRRNKELASQLRESDDARIDERLHQASQRPETDISAVANAAIEFRESGNIEQLKKIKLPIIEDILKTTASAPTRSVNFFDVLDAHDDFPTSVRDCLDELRAQWDLDEVPSLVPFFVEADLVRGQEKERVRVKLTPSLKDEPDEDDAPVFDCRWTGDDESSGILAGQSNKAEAEALGPSQTTMSVSQFRDRAPADVSVDGFLQARISLQRYEPWLERDAFALLLLHEDARNATREYVDAWVQLAGDASQLDDEPDFVETVQVLETVQGCGAAGEPCWIVLGPLHPFRLDPYLRVAERIVECVKSGCNVEKLGDAALWMLDRSYPAYPTIHRGRHTLHLLSHRGLIIYSKNPGQYLPSVREANGLDRVLRSVEGYSPWLLDGMSILAIDPPEGGGVVRALESARQRRGDNSLYVYHLTTGDETDTLDGFNGHLEYLARVDNLRDAQTFPPANLILRFAAESSGAGETAGTQWQATRGTHLALEISEVFQGGPFLTTRTPQIKIDPRFGNVVVRNMQALFRRLIGGSPMLATIRPLLRTDDAEVLSRMARETDWIVFAAPGPLGLVSPRTINDTPRTRGW